ncbi:MULTISPECIES: DNA repair exonuclease [unclassified Achromobacter]|uniref:metallophosphoesterase family protein n=1 Tax=unclassified Achromobacter TaxID=2626865 RepID=UPI000B51D8F0|nr:MULTISPECIES: DNA repair exonuclease [unclassified Achromobacter]OWT74650.1 DNA repair exonuclease [Achromobacter sp. HZ34]OWT79117.1 DNA repair exonuclease [Achromobacter sp. HZ28]
MLKILHTSDWQIGKLFGQFDSDDAALLADARFQVVEGLARLAQAEQVDLILVAGDVFDAQTVADRTIHRLFKAMSAYAGPWIMIPGNHDAGLAESVWTRAQRLGAVPDNVTICLRSEPLIVGLGPQSAALPAYVQPGSGLPASGQARTAVAILPAPMTQRNTYADLTEWFAGADTPAGLPRIGMAHGSVQGILAEGIDSTNPIAAGRAAQARLDYLALGDWHGARQIDERTWYSGTPETDRFRANASGCALLVSLDGAAAPRVEARATGRYRWQSERATLRVPGDVDAVIATLNALTANDVVALEIDGQIDLQGHRRLLAAIEQARGTARGVLADLGSLRLAPTQDDIDALQADGYVGEVIAELRAAQEGPGADGDDARIARDALALLAGMLA